jgi:hypothetical protein
MRDITLPRLARLCLALTAALSSQAHAGLVSYSSSVGTMGRLADLRSSLNYERFDASLGELREVRFTFDMRTDYAMGFSNQADHARQISFRYGTDVQFSLPSSWSADSEKWEYLEVASGAPEFFIQRSWTAQRSFNITDNLSRFIRDTPGSMDYQLQHYADGTWDDWSTLGFSAMSTTNVTMRLDYLYDDPAAPGQPLPEPGSFGLVFAACAAAGVGRRALRKHST